MLGQLCFRKPLLYHTGGITGGNRISGNIPGHHGSRADDGTVADLYPGNYNRTMPDPYIVADYGLVMIATGRIPYGFSWNIILMVIAADQRHIAGE